MGVLPKECNKTPKEIRAELGSENTYNLLYAGELSGRKNQRFLISSMPDIKKLIPHARLWLAGDGLQRAELEGLAKKLGVEEDVIFLGNRTDVGNYMNAADIYVSAAKSEGLPFNIIEAMLFGVPVLASRAKGQEDIIENGKSGYLFEPDKSNEFVECVKLIHDGIYTLKREDIIARAKEYSYDEVFSETLHLILEACDDKAHQSENNAR